MFITLEQIYQAKNVLAGAARRTPLETSATFSRMSGNEVYLKCENLQKTGAFKFRGAYNKIASLSEEEKSRGIITCSSGNHGAATACAAAMAGSRATVVLPKKHSQAKRAAMEGYGATALPHGKSSIEMFAKVEELIKAHGYTMVHPFDDPYVIAGQATIGLELIEDLPTLDAVLVQASGGGLLSGIASAVKQLKPSVRVIGVNAERSDGIMVSLAKGAVTPSATDSIADGLGAAQPGNLNFEYIKKYVDDFVSVTEQEIVEATRLAGQRAKLVVEPSGAVSLAALLSGKSGLKGKRVAAILSGGNVELGLLARIYNGEFTG